MILNNLLAFGRSSEENALASLAAGIGGLILTACIIKICITWERRAIEARTDLVPPPRGYGSTNLDNRVTNFRMGSDSMPPSTLPENYFGVITRQPTAQDAILRSPSQETTLSPSVLADATFV